MDWQIEQTGDRTRIYRASGRRSFSVEDALTGWRRASTFSRNFIETLAAIPFRAYLWEMPPVSSSGLDRCFEFAATACSRLDLPPDPAPFSDPLERAGNPPVAAFDNLGGDACLIVPRPDHDSGDAAHLAAFARTAALERQLALWRTVARSLASAIDDQPRWLSTSGLGVAWLHVRLDTMPKYFVHAPYRNPAKVGHSPSTPN